MKPFRLLLLCCLSQFLIADLNAKARIYGVVLDKENEEAIIAANVFIANTTKGTTTDIEGKFELKDVPEGEISVIISYVGFETYTKQLNVRTDQQIELRIELKQGTILNEVMVKAKGGRKRRKYMKAFRLNFLGRSENAKTCRIVNPDDILFESLPEGGFRALAKRLIQVENEALGYRISFYLQHFQQKGDYTSYEGKPFFELMEAQSKDQQELWDYNRKQSFLGSRRHFFQSLFANRLKEDGFYLNYMKEKSLGDFEYMDIAERAEVVKYSLDPNKQILSFNNCLQITYTKELDQDLIEEQRRMVSDNSSSRGMGIQMLRQKINDDSAKKQKYQSSIIRLKEPGVRFQANGLLAKTRSLVEYGYWTRERIGDLLPNDYELPGDNH